jgi:GT2 family glycosyltransferase
MGSFSFYSCFKPERMTSIIIVNFNSGNLLERCINSIYHRLNQYDFELIIVDNNSNDNSLFFLEKEKERSIIIFNMENAGFAKACNIGASKAKGDYLLFLNPDTTILSVNLQELKMIYEKDSKIGTIGVKQIGESGIIHKTCAQFPNAKQYVNKVLGLNKFSSRIFPFRFLDLNYDENQIVDQVIGSFLFMKKSIFRDHNGFDEQFFVFYEEMDLAYRLKLSGLDNFYFSKMSIYHLGGGTTSKVKEHRLIYSWESRLKFFKKHKGTIENILIQFITLVLEPLSRIVKALIMSSYQEIPIIIRAWKKVSLP